MINLPRRLLLVSILLLLAACTPRPIVSTPASGETASPLPIATKKPSALALPSPSPTQPSPTSILPTSSFTPTPSPLPLASFPRTHYQIQAEYSYSDQRLNVAETVDFTNTTGAELNDLVFEAEPNRRLGVFQPNSLTWADGQVIQDYELEENHLRLVLPRPLPPGEKLKISISYRLSLPKIPTLAESDRPSPFGYTSRQTNLVDWYLYLPPYMPGQGWIVNKPSWFGEHQVFPLADFDIDLHLDESGSALVVAASAPAQEIEKGYRYHLEAARSFAFSLSPEYQVSMDTVGGVTILSYALPFTPAAGQAALQDTAKAVELYTRLFGPYPHASLSVVEADFLDGMEYDGLYFLSRGFYNLYDGSPKGYLTAIAVHETAHQWFYGLVGNNQAEQPWLDEALSTYCEKLYYERVYPDMVAWWWAFRVDYYHPAGPVNLPVYTYDGFRPYVNAVYLRGAHFMEDLRKLAGDEAFFAFLKDYVSTYSGKIANSQDFFAILSRHTAENIQPLLEEYFAPE